MATQGDVAIAYARAQIGKPYVWASAGPDGFDCSGLVYAAYRAAGVKLGRTTYQQVFDGVPVKSEADLKPGDLRFPDAGHVQLYVGNGQIIEAPQQGENVRQTKVWGPFWAGRRVADTGTALPGGVETTGYQTTGLTDTFSGLEQFFSKLGQWETWARTGMIIGGGLMVIWGLYSLAGRTPIQQLETLTGVATKVAKSGSNG